MIIHTKLFDNLLIINIFNKNLTLGNNQCNIYYIKFQQKH